MFELVMEMLVAYCGIERNHVEVVVTSKDDYYKCRSSMSHTTNTVALHNVGTIFRIAQASTTLRTNALTIAANMEITATAVGRAHSFVVAEHVAAGQCRQATFLHAIEFK